MTATENPVDNEDRLKPPPPPSGDDNDDEPGVLTEDSSICSDFDDDLEAVANPGHRKPKSTKEDSDDSEESNRKKKKKPTTKTTPITKKKKKPKNKGDVDTSSTDDSDDTSEEDAVASSKPKRQSRKSKQSRDPNPLRTNKDENSSEDSESEDDQVGKQDDDHDGGAEFLIYYDPKTNTIGRIPRAVAATKSSLFVDKSNDKEQYKNVMTDQGEKQQLIFKLKKLQKQKPAEESWLDEIKREKALKSPRPQTPKKKYKSTALISRRSPGSFSNRSATSGSSRPNITNPLTDEPSKTGKHPTKRRNSKKQRQVADKPGSGGWSKPALQ